MKALLIGSNQDSPTGAAIEQQLVSAGWSVEFASRRTGCNATDATSVRNVLATSQPNAIVFTAGTFPTPQPLGQIENWDEVVELFAVKALGSLVVFDAAIRAGVPHVLVIAGTVGISSGVGNGHFTTANGALWNATQFAARHSGLNIQYLELGLILPSVMGEMFMAVQPVETHDALRAMSFTPAEVAEVVVETLRGQRTDLHLKLNRATL